MTLERFWRCVPCEALIRLGASDPLPEPDTLVPLWFVVAQRDRMVFFETHRMHLIESLTQTTPSLAASGPLSDPATVVRWEVSNASRTFVVEGSRTMGIPDPSAVTLDHPLRYRCLPGHLRIASMRIGVPVDELSRAIDDAVFPHVLPSARLRALTDAAAKSIVDLDADRLEILFDVPTDPTTSMARLADGDLDRVIASVGCLLDSREKPRLAERLRSLQASEGLLCTVTRHHEVELDL